MRKFPRLAWAVLAAAASVGAGCSSHDVKVDAASAQLSTFDSTIGQVNTPGFDLGDVVELDPQTHDFWKAARVQVRSTEVAYSQPQGKVAESFDSATQLDYSKKVAPELKEQVVAQVQEGTVFHADNYWTRSIKTPELFIIQSDQLSKRLAKLQAEHPDHRFFLVSAVSPAEKVFLAYESDKAGPSAGEYNFHVSYDQNAQLAKLAKEKPAFFKLTALKTTTYSGQTVARMDKSASPELGDSRYEPAYAATW
jgi:hypothetical protein